jgi:hypothetical protein
MSNEEIPQDTFLTVNATSTRGDAGKCLVVDGYDFTKQRDNGDGTTVYQCCEMTTETKCKVTAKLDGKKLISMKDV